MLFVFFLSSASGVARAESAVLRPLPELPAATASEQLAQQTASESLRAANVNIIEADEARQRLRQAAENPCLEVNCASSVLRVLDADMLVAVSLASDGEVLVALVDANGRHVNASAPSPGGDVAAATRAAVNRALSKWPTRALVPIKFSGTPSGATVTVDGQPRGMLPLEVRVQPGRHEVVVTMSGYRAHRQSVEASGGSSAAPSLEVELEAESSQGEAAAAAGPSRLPLIAGPILAAAGAATMAVALGSFSRAGCTQHAPDGVCVERHEVAAGPVAAWTTVGALALVGGVSWFAIGMRRSNKARHLQAQVDLSWNHVSLRGSF